MKAYPSYLLLGFLLLSTLLPGQRVDLTGIVSIHNSKYRTGQIEYVANAQVSADYTSPTSTDSKGNFTLTFIGLDAGTTVNLEVEHHQWEVVNAYDLFNVIIGRKLPLRVAMGNKDSLALYQADFYQISKEALFAEYEERIAVLEKGGAEAEALIADLNAELKLEIRGKNEAIYELKKQLEAAQKRLPAFAKELAYVNLDFASDLYIEAYELLKEGKIRAALKVLDDAHLEQKAEASLTAIRESKRGIQQLEETVELRTQEVEQIIAAYKLKAKGHELLFE